ncbi:hypothetical protein IW261DRAFT_1484512 [Armillaria novae-zelandiae]|uniref:Uncharacterized protein n=1 Tax=Armillaria novae-zelandiae TaxID=153914 RepID=A0AA39P5M3_9AGAR|nr:hypothetical protein IW261DRAFT_1484512 [Armillaria novae-zelandiae]
MEDTIAQDMRLRTAIIRGVEIQLIRNRAIALMLNIQNNFNEANAADHAPKWIRLVESSLFGITDFEAQTASTIATREDWYKAVYARFVAVLSLTPLSGELFYIYEDLKRIHTLATRESDRRMLEYVNGLASSGTNPAPVQYTGYDSSVDTISSRGSISPPTSDYNASSSSFAGSDGSVNSRYQSRLQERARIEQLGGSTKPYICASAPAYPPPGRSPSSHRERRTRDFPSDNEA